MQRAAPGPGGCKAPALGAGRALPGVGLQLVAVDVAKARIKNALRAGTGWRFSDSLSDE